MSKSKKKQSARKRASEDGSTPTSTPELEVLEGGAGATDEDFDEFDDGPSDMDEPPALALPEKNAQPLNEALYDQAVAAATAHGVMRDEGEAIAYLYNGDTLSMKFTEGAEGTGEPDRLMIAAFRKGVVFQTEGQTQVVYQPGDWEAEIARLAGMPAAEPEDA